MLTAKFLISYQVTRIPTQGGTLDVTPAGDNEFWVKMFGNCGEFASVAAEEFAGPAPPMLIHLDVRIEGAGGSNEA